MKPSWLRSLAPVVAFLLLVAASPGCRKKVPAPTSAPEQQPVVRPAEAAPPAVTLVVPPADPPETGPAPELPAPPNPTSLEAAEDSFKAGHYEKAARSFASYLGANPAGPDRDRALFYLGLSYVLPNGTGRNAPRAAEAFRRLIRDFPRSPYRNPAEYILGLQLQVENMKLDIKEKEARIKQLSDELQKLKDIDLQRRPSRPPS